MKKTLIISIVTICVLLVGVLVYVNYNARTSQDDLTLDVTDGDLGTFPVINSFISPTYDMVFLVDTGSDLSMICPETIQQLKKKGFKVDSVFCPVFYRNNNGDILFTTKRYIADIPIHKWNSTRSANGSVFYECDTTKDINVMRNVNFIPSPDNINILGLDLLRHMVMEYRVDRGTLSFVNKVPEGYEFLTHLDEETSFWNIVGCANRYTLKMSVGDFTNDYIVDTALDLVSVKHPASDSVNARSRLQTRAHMTPHGRMLQTRISPKEWAQMGARAGSTTVSYFNDGNSSYAINPVRFTSQDIVFDFINNRICLRPQFDVIGYPDKLPSDWSTTLGGIRQD